jgi:hypothetical protein
MEECPAVNIDQEETTMAKNSTTRVVTRREFNAASIAALFVGMTVWVGGCGSGSSNPAASPTPIPTPTQPTTGPGDKSGAITANHGHAATVTNAQLQASGAVTLNIQGTADHAHAVELSSEQVRQIASGSRVSKVSSQTDGEDDGYGGTMPGHAHTVTFN